MTVEEAIKLFQNDFDDAKRVLDAGLFKSIGKSGLTAQYAYFTMRRKEKSQIALQALREQQKRDKGCVYCTSHQPLETDGGGELEVVQIIPLPAINLTTGETEKNSAPPFYALLFQAFEGELEDFVPIRCCPMCGRELKEG